MAVLPQVDMGNFPSRKVNTLKDPQLPLRLYATTISDRVIRSVYVGY